MGKLLSDHLSDGLTVDSADYDQRSALHLAASEGSLACVQLLLKQGANVNCKDRWNGTPLDDAIRTGKHDDVLQYLVDNGGRTGDDREAVKRLFAAVEEGDLHQVDNLIRTGTPVDIPDYDKRTALHVAVAAGHADMICSLCRAGADVNAVDSFNLTPLGEAARHATRTGENKIRDLLLSLGGRRTENRTQPSSKFFYAIGAFQTFFLICFAVGTKYDESTEMHSVAYANSQNYTGASSPEAVKTTYGMFQDVHVMIFVGFGFLMTFLRKYGYSSVGLNFLVASFAIQWHLICGGFVHMLFEGHGVHTIGLNLNSLLLADFASAAVLITYGALLGKVTPVQILLLSFFEIFLFSINENILLKIGIMDVGGSIIVHMFGAYFGLAASWVLSPKEVRDDPENSANYHSDVFAMAGTLFLFVFWPSFVSAPAAAFDQERAVIATLLALVGSCVAAFVASQKLRGGRFCMVDVQNATLAGGVAIGTSANLAVMSPAEALAIGIAAGILSVVGYIKIQPALQRRLKLHDTCGVNNLHGMPGILAGVVSAIVTALSSREQFPSLSHQLAVYGARNIGAENERTAVEQAGFQLLCVIVSFVMATASGLICGLIVQRIDRMDVRNLFKDSGSWEVPELETPFYFDKRGEINRDMLHVQKTTAPSPRDVAITIESAGKWQNSNRDVISNELLNMKLDLLLQQEIPPRVSTHVGL